MTRAYRVLIEAEPDGGFAVWVPALPGCASQGESPEEAFANIKEAIQCYIESAKKHGEPIPDERAPMEAMVEVAV